MAKRFEWMTAFAVAAFLGGCAPVLESLSEALDDQQVNSQTALVAKKVKSDRSLYFVIRPKMEKPYIDYSKGARTTILGVVRNSQLNWDVADDSITEVLSAVEDPRESLVKNADIVANLKAEEYQEIVFVTFVNDTMIDRTSFGFKEYTPGDAGYRYLPNADFVQARPEKTATTENGFHLEYLLADILGEQVVWKGGAFDDKASTRNIQSDYEIFVAKFVQDLSQRSRGH